MPLFTTLKIYALAAANQSRLAQVQCAPDVARVARSDCAESCAGRAGRGRGAGLAARERVPAARTA